MKARITVDSRTNATRACEPTDAGHVRSEERREEVRRKGASKISEIDGSGVSEGGARRSSRDGEVGGLLGIASRAAAGPDVERVGRMCDTGGSGDTQRHSSSPPASEPLHQVSRPLWRRSAHYSLMRGRCTHHELVGAGDGVDAAEQALQLMLNAGGEIDLPL